LYQDHFINSTETQLTSGKGDDVAPKFSPDGKLIGFIRDGAAMMTIDPNTKVVTEVAKATIGRPPFFSPDAFAWSPDNKWIAYLNFGNKSFQNVFVAPAAGGEGRQLSFLANSFAGSVNWSKDGKFILFTTGQRTENSAIARIDLVPQTPKFKEEQFRNLFNETTPSTPATSTPATSAASKPAADTLFKKNDKPAKEPVKIVWEGLRQRTTLLPIDVDAGEVIISPDGNTMVLVGGSTGQVNLFSYSLDELSKEPAVLKQLTTSGTGKSEIQFS